MTSRKTKRLGRALMCAGGLVLALPALAQAALTTTQDAAAISSAVAANPSLISGASWVDVGGGGGPAGPAAAGVFAGAGPQGFPKAGGSFAVLSTGDATLANATASASSSTTTSFGRSARGAQDPTVLRLDLNVPAGRNCLALDLVFLSEEFPEYVGSSFNDAALIELDQNSWAVSGSDVSAPANFAFDDVGNPLTINNARFLSDVASTGTEFDGSTRQLTASTQISPGAHSIYVSIFDVGDSAYDSAVFLDNLRAETLSAAECGAGAQIADADGDGLPDRWEKDGYDHDGDGDIDVDLPAMGADPRHKDLFVEMDAMENLRLSAGALSKVVSSFAAAPLTNPDGQGGVTLHVDNGQGSVMNPKTGATWGDRSRSQNVPYQKSLGSKNGDGYDWSDFQGLKNTYFDKAREPVFRYAMSINRYAGSGSSGIARGIPGSDLIVSLGSFCSEEGQCPGSVNAQAGTFMHELGHTLSFRHGGDNHVNYKPNFLSVMNYHFQFAGVVGGPQQFDYSRFGTSSLFGLFEGSLDEANGFGPNQGDPAASYTTLIRCNGFLGINEDFKQRSVTRNVDFNCDDDADDTDVKSDLNNLNGDQEVHQPHEDWSGLTFAGGSVGGAGRDVLQPQITAADEATPEELLAPLNAIVTPPTATTGAATNIVTNAAALNGSYSSDRPATVSFRYGPDGSALTSESAPANVSGTGDFAAALTGLLPGRRYRYRAVITTPDHITTGTDGAFTTTQNATDPPATAPAPAPAAGPIQPGAGGVIKPAVPARTKSQCSRPATKQQWRRCYRELQKASCSGVSTRTLKRCRSRVIARVCKSAAATASSKVKRTRVRGTCVRDLRKVARKR